MIYYSVMHSDLSKKTLFLKKYLFYKKTEIKGVFSFSNRILPQNANIEILRMTGEVTDRFNEITLFGMALFWEKTIEFSTKFMIHFLTCRVERLFN